ncbi:MAG: hypothetical protein ACI9YT_003024, partial [Halobacteriales archaeon]
MTQTTDDATGTDPDRHDPDLDREGPDLDRDTPQYHGARAALYGALAAPFVHPGEGAIDDLAHDDAIEGILTAADRVGVES